ncbi:MAG: DUF1949 domain-containing protein [Sarcina sp.]
MLTIDNFVFDTIKRLDTIEVGNCLDIRSYKKNRKVIIEKLEESYNLYEDGFYKEEFLDLTKEELKKILRGIEKKEFPRSNKLRFYVLDSREESVCRANYREEIEEKEEEGILAYIELPYAEITPLKKIIDDHDGVVEKIDYRDIVGIKINILEEEFDILKEALKDKLEVKLYKL